MRFVLGNSNLACANFASLSPLCALGALGRVVVANANIRRGAGLAYLAVVFALCHGLAIRKRRAKVIANDAASHD